MYFGKQKNRPDITRAEGFTVPFNSNEKAKMKNNPFIYFQKAPNCNPIHSLWKHL